MRITPGLPHGGKDRVQSLLARSSKGIGLLLAVGCASPTFEAGSLEQPIVGGGGVAQCGWPSVVLAGGCSGVLVHPRLMVTAAHCVQEGITQIDLGENDSAPARSMGVTRCVAHPAYNGDTDDIGFCLLARDVTELPIVPVMAACELAGVNAGDGVIEVGFGQSAVSTGPNDGFGLKRWVGGKVATVASDRGQIDATTGTQDGEYYGDSGGPLFFQMPDGTWRVLGIDSSSPDIIPGSSAARISKYTSVPAHIAWLESTSGVDLTACHDEGGWSPSAACTGFPIDPATGVGGWGTFCSGQTLATPQMTCDGQDAGVSADGGTDTGPKPPAIGDAGLGVGDDGKGSKSNALTPSATSSGTSDPESTSGSNALGADSANSVANVTSAAPIGAPVQPHARSGCSLGNLREGPSGGGKALLFALCLGLLVVGRRRPRTGSSGSNAARRR